MSKKSATKSAPKGRLDTLLEQFLTSVAKKHTEAHAYRLSREVGQFVAWAEGKAVKQLSSVNVRVAERYRAHCEKQGWALTTKRMHLARVQTFLRAHGVSKEVLKVLRVEHTKAEKEHLAELRAAREVAA